MCNLYTYQTHTDYCLSRRIRACRRHLPIQGETNRSMHFAIYRRPFVGFGRY